MVADFYESSRHGEYFIIMLTEVVIRVTSSNPFIQERIESDCPLIQELCQTQLCTRRNL